jgi:hypothetical protein
VICAFNTCREGTVRVSAEGILSAAAGKGPRLDRSHPDCASTSCLSRSQRRLPLGGRLRLMRRSNCECGARERCEAENKFLSISQFSRNCRFHRDLRHLAAPGGEAPVVSDVEGVSLPIGDIGPASRSGGTRNSCIDADLRVTTANGNMWSPGIRHCGQSTQPLAQRQGTRST